MKKIFISAFLLLSSEVIYAQFYVSATGGYAWGVPTAKVGEELIHGKEKVNFGTFGEGLQSQIRLGYFFTKTWGIDLGLGYLHGASQVVRREVSQKNIGQTPFTATVDGEVLGQGRAYGASFSVIYNFTDNFYGRFGLLTKIGGKTQAIARSTTTTNQALPLAPLMAMGLKLSLPAGLAPSLMTNALVEKGARIITEYEEDYKGKIPFGTIASLGYKYTITPKISVFAELEYMNISVKRDYSALQSFNQILEASVAVESIKTPIATTLMTLEGFENGIYDDKLRNLVYRTKTTYVEEGQSLELAKKDTDLQTKKLTEKASYSSLGLNFGVSYSF